MTWCLWQAGVYPEFMPGTSEEMGHYVHVVTLAALQ